MYPIPFAVMEGDLIFTDSWYITESLSPNSICFSHQKYKTRIVLLCLSKIYISKNDYLHQTQSVTSLFCTGWVLIMQVYVPWSDFLMFSICKFHSLTYGRTTETLVSSVTVWRLMVRMSAIGSFHITWNNEKEGVMVRPVTVILTLYWCDSIFLLRNPVRKYNNFKVGISKEVGFFS